MSTEQSAPVLDDITRVQSVDKRNMLRLINEMPEHCETALAIGRGFVTEPLALKPNVVLFVGVGESGLAADIAAEVLSDDIEVPVMSQHVSPMPACITEESVVFVIDYYGNTQTAIRACRYAMACKARTICVTTGGRLREIARDSGVQVLSIPAGQPARCGIVYMALAPLTAIQNIGLASSVDQKASGAVRLLKNIREFVRFEIPTTRNIAKQVAEMLYGRTPVILGSADYRRLVGRRWASQIGANAKHPACFGSLPDLADGEICAWERVVPDACEPAFVFLSDELDRTTENLIIQEAAKELLARFPGTDIEMKGANPVERMFYGMYLGDYVSYYIALMGEVDPYKTESAELISERLAPSESQAEIATAPAEEEESEDI
ncbi:MAG: SIS domain-containing protein [Armatimonadota bacterium]